MQKGLCTMNRPNKQSSSPIYKLLHACYKHAYSALHCHDENWRSLTSASKDAEITDGTRLQVLKAPGIFVRRDNNSEQGTLDPTGIQRVQNDFVFIRELCQITDVHQAIGRSGGKNFCIRGMKPNLCDVITMRFSNHRCRVRCADIPAIEPVSIRVTSVATSTHRTMELTESTCSLSKAPRPSTKKTN